MDRLCCGGTRSTADERSTDAQEFRDRSTGLPLNLEMVKRARELEMQHMEELKVLEDSDRDACMAQTGRPPIPTDWVDINKGDSLRPKTVDVEDWALTFAATPPYEAFRLQLSLLMTGPRSEIQGDRAHLHPPSSAECWHLTCR